MFFKVIHTIISFEIFDVGDYYKDIFQFNIKYSSFEQAEEASKRRRLEEEDEPEDENDGPYND